MSTMFKVKYLPTAPDETSNNEHNVQGKISSNSSRMTRLMSKMFKVKYLPTAPDETSNNEYNVQGEISSNGSR